MPLPKRAGHGLCSPGIG